MKSIKNRKYLISKKILLVYQNKIKWFYQKNLQIKANRQLVAEIYILKPIECWVVLKKMK